MNGVRRYFAVGDAETLTAAKARREAQGILEDARNGLEPGL